MVSFDSGVYSRHSFFWWLSTLTNFLLNFSSNGFEYYLLNSPALPCSHKKVGADRNECLNGVGGGFLGFVGETVEFGKDPSLKNALNALNKFIPLMAQYHPKISLALGTVSFILGLTAKEQEEVDPILEAINEGFDQLNDRLDTIEESIDYISKDIMMSICQKDIGGPIYFLKQYRKEYNQAFENNERSLWHNFMMAEEGPCYNLKKIDGPFGELSKELLSEFGGETCLDAIKNNKKYYLKAQLFDEEIVRPVVTAVIHTLEMAAACPYSELAAGGTEFSQALYKSRIVDNAEAITNKLNDIMVDFDDDWMKKDSDDYRLALSNFDTAEEIRFELESNWSKKYIYSVLRYPVHDKSTSNGEPDQHAIDRLGDEREGVVYFTDHENVQSSKYFTYIFYLKIADRYLKIADRSVNELYGLRNAADDYPRAWLGFVYGGENFVSAKNALHKVKTFGRQPDIVTDDPLVFFATKKGERGTISENKMYPLDCSIEYLEFNPGKVTDVYEKKFYWCYAEPNKFEVDGTVSFAQRSTLFC